MEVDVVVDVMLTIMKNKEERIKRGRITTNLGSPSY